MEYCLLKCQSCSRVVGMDRLAGQCECGGTLLVEYDLDRVKRTFTPDVLSRQPCTMWRYEDLLPVRRREAIVSLGEGWTPLVRLDRAEKRFPLGELWVKREEQNPTGSFKARGFTSAVSLLNERNIRKVTVPSNGNAASALAAYAARAGMEATVFLPMDSPIGIQEECVLYGADTYLVDGYIHDAAAIIEEGRQDQHWFNVGTLKEPGRVEGKKTMGLELAEQMGWHPPDVIVYPTGGGSGIIGMWKAFRELKALGLIDGDPPKLVSVQETGCQPLVDAVRSGAREVLPQAGEVTSNATGLRVPKPPDGNLLLRIIRETGGTAVAVDAEQIRTAQSALGEQGISASPEGAATWAGLEQLCDTGFIGRADRVVLFNTSHAMKYMECLPSRPIPVIRTYGDWVKLQRHGGRTRERRW